MTIYWLLFFTILAFFILLYIRHHYLLKKRNKEILQSNLENIPHLSDERFLQEFNAFRYYAYRKYGNKYANRCNRKTFERMLEEYEKRFL